jgi:hypothetical protein
MYRWAGKQSVPDEWILAKLVSQRLACASDGDDIVSSENGRLSEAGQNFCLSRLACASINGLTCAVARCWQAGNGGWNSCSSGLAGASDGEAGWPNERCRSLAESAVVLLLVDSLLRCSLDARVVVTDVTDASVKVKVTLRLTVNQSVCLGVGQIFLLVWMLLSCPCGGTHSDERTGLSFVRVTVSNISQLSVGTIIYILLLTKCLYIQYIQGLCQSRFSTTHYILF